MSNNNIMQRVRHRCLSMEFEDSFCVLNGKPESMKSLRQDK